MASNKCAHCGKEDFQTSYMDCEEKKRMDRDGLCFNCAFWSLKTDVKPSRRTIIDGAWYGPGNRTSGEFRGMGGRRFDIEYLSDGCRITTFDLWSGGIIPDSWRDKLPDTAIFLNGAERAQAGDTTCFNPSETNSEPYPLPKDAKRAVAA